MPTRNLNSATRLLTAAILAISTWAGAAFAQDVTVETVMVPGPSLEGNLEGNDTTRSLVVFLPPSYAEETDRHYPVVYALHGYTSNNEYFKGDLDRTNAIEDAFAKGSAEMIVVMPNAQTVHDGSMYTSSVTTGDWESYIADDIVAYVDANYRTIPDRESRGLAGHSMGGYGTLRIGMKRPDVFSALYAMSPCCLVPGQAPDAAMIEKLQGLESPAMSKALPFFEKAMLASAAAWSPNPTKPPFYLDLPEGENSASVMARWTANAPAAMADQYMFTLAGYNAIAIDIGDQDWLLPGAQEMDRILTENTIEHTFEIYEGDHVNRVSERFEDHVMPFFSEHLSAE